MTLEALLVLEEEANGLQGILQSAEIRRENKPAPNVI
jgi:hypothetical protein